MDKKTLFKKLENEELSFEDIFENNFMKKYTSFSSFSSFNDEIQERCSRTKASGEKVIEKIVEEMTQFRNFEKMKEMAINEYCLRH